VSQAIRHLASGIWHLSGAKGFRAARRVMHLALVEMLIHVPASQSARFDQVRLLVPPTASHPEKCRSPGDCFSLVGMFLLSFQFRGLRLQGFDALIAAK